MSPSEQRDQESAANRQLPPIGVLALILAIGVGTFVGIRFIDHDEREERRKSPVEVRLADSSQMERGEVLAANLCDSCHLVPVPDILPKTEWRVVLSYMGFFLGQELGLGEDERHYRDYQKSDFSSPDERQDEVEFILKDLQSRHAFLTALELVPEAPAVSDDSWEAIRAYYEGAAPEVTLPVQQHEPVGEVPFFVAKPNYYLGSPRTTLLHIDERAQELYVGGMGVKNARGPAVAIFSPDGEIKRNMILRGAPISVSVVDGGFFLSLIGSFFPNLRDLRPARIVYYDRDASVVPSVKLNSLPRLANSAVADLNGDSLLDIVTCEHGHGLLELGAVSWYPGTPTGFGAAQPLLDYPGCVRVDLQDMNGDGRLDVVALMAGGREGLQLLINQGNGKFDGRAILTKHPAFGFVYSELADFDGDGDLDVLTVNGDNQDGDMQNRARRYHGLRIHLNDGTGELSEAFFFHLHGAVMARARDFDGDGDLDVAAISSYPRSGDGSPVSFVYLQNEGDLEFTPWTHAANDAGRWMVMDAGDLDGDGDVDIVLGGFSDPVGLVGEIARETMKGESPAFLILENTR